MSPEDITAIEQRGCHGKDLWCIGVLSVDICSRVRCPAARTSVLQTTRFTVYAASWHFTQRKMSSMPQYGSLRTANCHVCEAACTQDLTNVTWRPRQPTSCDK